jgi:hypothetical protein
MRRMLLIEKEKSSKKWILGHTISIVR